MEKLLYKMLLENLEIVAVKDGGGDTTAIALTYTTIEESQDSTDIEIAAKELAKELADKLKAEM